MKQPVDHIERPRLPWRDERLTECRLSADSYPTITRDGAVTRCRELGKTRFAMTVCITCMQTAERHLTWEQDPVSAMLREVEGARWYRKDGTHDQMRTELKAIALLIAAHRDEFDETIASLGETSELAAKREAKRRNIIARQGNII